MERLGVFKFKGWKWILGTKRGGRAELLIRGKRNEFDVDGPCFSFFWEIFIFLFF